MAAVASRFEQLTGRPAKFSFRGEHHGGFLARVLARLDRYTGEGWQAGAGVEEVIYQLELAAAAGELAEIHTLAYFLPLLDEISKGRRRLWKVMHGHRGMRWKGA